MGKGHRSNRLGEEIRKILSQMLISEIKDPRLKNSIISVSSVDVTKDGSYATCYVSVLSGNEESEEVKKYREDEVIAGLNSAKGLIKREIGREIKLRHIPELIFKIDTSIEYGNKIDKLLLGLND